MLVQAGGASLTVMLDNVANRSFVRADGVRIVQLTGAVNQNNDAHLQSGSPAIAAGDPATPYLSEPLPNGDRVDIGAYGDTSQSTASTNPLIQVLNPSDLAKVQVGSTVSIDLHSAGLLPYDYVARLALGSGNLTGTNASGWSDQNYRTDPYGAYNTTTSGTINLNPAAPSYVATVNAITGTGSNGTYTNVVLSGGTGSGAQATVVVAGGVVTSVTITASGSGYALGESLSFTITGGSGTCKVATLSVIANSSYLIANTAPASLYSDVAYEPGGIGNQMTFQLPVANGTYQMVLDFVEPDNIAAGQRQFDIIINGQTVAANVDVVALAGGYNSAVSLSFTVTVSGGQGINLVLKNDSASYGAIISGIEIRHANAQGVADPVVSLQLSTDGGNTWNPIATGVTLDQYGNAVVNWMPTAAEITAGNTAYIRATASLDGVTTAATGTSAPFLIASDSHHLLRQRHRQRCEQRQGCGRSDGEPAGVAARLQPGVRAM